MPDPRFRLKIGTTNTYAYGRSLIPLFGLLRPSAGVKPADLQTVTPALPAHLGTYGDQDLVEYIDVGATYYFNKNMSTFVDYKINLLDDSDFTKAAKVSTDNIVAVGLNYQF